MHNFTLGYFNPSNVTQFNMTTSTDHGDDFRDYGFYMNDTSIDGY